MDDQEQINLAITYLNDEIRVAEDTIIEDIERKHRLEIELSELILKQMS